MTERQALGAAAAVSVASILIALAAALTRGPWLDEFWTVFATDPSLPLATEASTRWLTDVHPPLFYLLARGAASWLGDDVTRLRLVNLPAMAGLLAFFCHAGAVWQAGRRFLLIYAVLAFSSYFATGYFAEYRSYYWQFSAAICLFGSGYALLRGDVFGTARDRWITGAVFATGAVLLINLHFIAALLAEIAIGAMALAAWLGGRGRLGAIMAATGLAAALPLAAILAIQAPYLAGAGGSGFWIRTGLGEAVVILAGSLAKGVGLSVAACALAVWAVGSGTVGGRRRAGPGDGLIGAAFLGATVACVLVLGAINAYRPVIIDRYLLVCSATACCGLAVLSQEIAFRRRGGFAAIVLNAALFLGIAGHKLVNEPRWNESAEIVAERVAACPATDVAMLAFPYPGTLQNEGAVFALAYAYLAERHSFAARLSRPGGPPARTEGGCPALLWTEHVPWTLAPGGGSDRLVRDAAGPMLGALERPGCGTDSDASPVIRTRTGAVMVLDGSCRRE